MAIEEMGIFTADILFVITLLALGLLIKDSSYRIPMWTCAGIYLFFATLWHLYAPMIAFYS